MRTIHPTRISAVRGWMIAGKRTLDIAGSHGQFGPGQFGLGQFENGF